MVSEINTIEVYKQIKKQNSERFARVLRHEGLLDVPDILDIIKYAGQTEQDAQQLVGYLRWFQIRQTKKTYVKETNLEPHELLDMAGYNAYYVETLEQQNAIKKYFQRGEELCTFNDFERYKDFYIINAVKKDVDEIKRKDFTKPERQDRYGTSVISIQISKDGGYVSIKNRYNHKVNNPDATFDNNPDNIIPGLKYSLQKHFNVFFFTPAVPIPDGFMLYKEHIVRYYQEVNNVYIGDGYYVNVSGIHNINKDFEVQLDHFILDLRTNQVRDIINEDDEFVRVFNKEIQGKKIEIKIDKSTKEKIILANGCELARTKNGQLTSLILYNTLELGGGFLMFNKALKELKAPKIKKIAASCLCCNTELVELNLPELEKMCECCFYENKSLAKVNLPKIKEMGKSCFYENESITELSLPRLKRMDESCFYKNNSLVELYLPELEIMGAWCFNLNQSLVTVSLPKLTRMKEYCFFVNKSITKLNLPELKIMEGSCFVKNNSLIKLVLPKLEKMGGCCFGSNETIKTINAPLLKTMGYTCFHDNKALTKLSLPSLKTMGFDCFYSNKSIADLDMPVLSTMGNSCFHDNEALEILDFPKLRTMHFGCFRKNTNITRINTPKLIILGVLCANGDLRKIRMLQRREKLKQGMYEIKNRAKNIIDFALNGKNRGGFNQSL